MTVEIHALHKRFRSGGSAVHAIRDLDLSIGAGEIVAFLGPNGAGKTTTIDMILGLTTPTSGSIRVFGGTPRDAVRSGKVGALMQTGGLLRDFTVHETLRAIAALQRCPERVDEVLVRTNLTELAKRMVSKCSGGEQQRIKFAIALLTDPDLLVLDEPTTGMDVAVRREFWAAMRDEARSGRTILFATHYLEEAQNFAQRIVLIGQGTLLADGPVAQIQAMASGRTVSATYTSAPSKNQLVALHDLGACHIEVNGTRVTLDAPDSDAIARHLLDAGASDLTISPPTLESAFLSLTKDNR